jgi:hypothetical protein
MGLDGVEIITNSSGSHHELRKLHLRLEIIKEATGKVLIISKIWICIADILRVVEYIFMPIRRAVMAIVCSMMDLLW